jgi:hypothetical protein
VHKIGPAHYAFVGLERVGGFLVFDVSEPAAPRFITYMNNRDPAVPPALGLGGDCGPEGLLVIDDSASPVGAPLLVVTNEVSSTVTLYRIDRISPGQAGR